MTPTDDFHGDHLTRVTAPVELEHPANRERWGLGRELDDRGPYLIELNVLHVDGLAGAESGFLTLFREVFPPGDEDGPPAPVRVAKSYLSCELSLPEWKRLVAADEARAERTIYKLWPDFPVQARITHSIATIKADAALRSFDATGDGITWAVIDSGVQAAHPHFGGRRDHTLLDPSVRNLHRSFVPVDRGLLADPDEIVDGVPLPAEERERRLTAHREQALDDPLGHGTHVAGIITGRLAPGEPAVILEKEERLVAGDEQENEPQRKVIVRERAIGAGAERGRVHGVAPGCRIVSLRALDDDGTGRSSTIVRALEYIRERLNDNPKIMRVHGVNLSVGYEFDAEMFACGQSPLCTEVNRLVQAGVVVVTAAGNTGYTTLAASGRATKVALSNTINDPGNAEYAITVGATHRDAPHTYGVSYFSSKGPTGDGRLKPDLVAPGERIVSCSTGSKGTSDGKASYVEARGTSMAAPHVSGAIAAFLSIRREFIGQPLRVKQIFLDSAVPLGRERYFEGHGLVDLMKAIQSV
jgi:serine protease AprX